jgi:hypothetical protein
VITIDDTSDFDTDGTLQVAGQVIAYTAVNDDTGKVTLAAAVTGSAETGDVVTLWDTGLDQPAVEYRAHVELPGVLDNADAVDATIRHTLIGYLEEGIRTPGTGESVRMERHGFGLGDRRRARQAAGVRVQRGRSASAPPRSPRPGR